MAWVGRSATYMSVCTFVFPHDIFKNDATRITKLNVDVVHNESWKPVYFGIRRSKVKVTRHKNCWSSEGTPYWRLLLGFPVRSPMLLTVGFPCLEFPAVSQRRRGSWRSRECSILLIVNSFSQYFYFKHYLIVCSTETRLALNGLIAMYVMIYLGLCRTISWQCMFVYMVEQKKRIIYHCELKRCCHALACNFKSNQIIYMLE